MCKVLEKQVQELVLIDGVDCLFGSRSALTGWWIVELYGVEPWGQKAQQRQIAVTARIVPLFGEKRSAAEAHM